LFVEAIYKDLQEKRLHSGTKHELHNNSYSATEVDYIAKGYIKEAIWKEAKKYRLKNGLH